MILTTITNYYYMKVCKIQKLVSPLFSCKSFVFSIENNTNKVCIINDHFNTFLAHFLHDIKIFVFRYFRALFQVVTLKVVQTDHNIMVIIILTIISFLGNFDKPNSGISRLISCHSKNGFWYRYTTDLSFSSLAEISLVKFH